MIFAGFNLHWPTCITFNEIFVYSVSSVDSDDSYCPPPKKRGRKPRAVKGAKKSIDDEDLKPLVMVKKSRKQFVPDEKKDDRYWARRRKNNMAAKRSRDARRAKENQIVVRAGALEKLVRISMLLQTS